MILAEKQEKPVLQERLPMNEEKPQKQERLPSARQDKPSKQEKPAKLDKPTKQYKLTLPYTQYKLKHNLRNQEQSTKRLEEQIRNVEDSVKWFCPFLLEYYQIVRNKAQPNEYILRAAKQSITLDNYLKKDIPIKKKLLVINNILDALIEFQSKSYASLSISPRNIMIVIDDSQPVAKLPVHLIWKKKNAELFFNSRELFLSDNKADLAFISPQIHNKSVTVIDLGKCDLWSLALTIVQILWVKEQIKIDYTSKGAKYNLEEVSLINLRYQPNLKKVKFFHEDECIKLVTQNLWFDPNKRTTSLITLKECFEKAITERQTPLKIDLKNVREFGINFLSQKKTKQSELRNYISSDFSLLTQDLQTKLITYLQSRKHKVIKPETFRKHYKASTFNFSSRIFHQKCDTLRNLLVIFETTDHKRFCAYTPVPFDLDSLEGIFGAYSPDETGQSFLYSITHNEFYSLKDKSKAIGVSPNHGPIFGQSDIVIGDSNLANMSKFPKSYQMVGKAGKGKLTTHEVFSLLEYEVYVVSFM